MSASHSLAQYAVRIARGNGLVARRGGIVMYIADATASADRLLAAINSISDTEHPGAVIAQRLTDLAFTTDSASVAPFGLVAPTADGLLVLLRGNVIAKIDAANDAHELSGQRAFTWVDEIVRAPVRRITVSGGSRTSAHPHTDLRAGVVPGGGFILCHVHAADRPARAESVAAQPMRGQEPTQAAPPPVETARVVRPRCRPPRISPYPVSWNRRTARSTRWIATMSSGVTHSATTPCATQPPRRSPCTTTNTFRGCTLLSRPTAPRCGCAMPPPPAAPSLLPLVPRIGPESPRRQPNSNQDGACGWAIGS